VDVFPSVHVAASFYLLLFDWKHWRRRFWLVLLPCQLLWFSALYLRFHYFVDLLAGVVAALAGWWVAEKYATLTADQPMFATQVNDRTL
jgi:membrane-associated phospholipid phosphatase